MVVSAALALPVLRVVLRLIASAGFDLAVQDRLFDFAACRWLVAHDAPLPKLVFYSGPKTLFIGAALLMLVLVLWPERGLSLLPRPLRSRNRRVLGYVLTSMVLLPGVVALLKNASRVPCPYDVDRYCGELPHRHPFEHPPQVGARVPERGGCFPAAHASGAFSLMALFFVGRSRRQRLLLLAAAVALGWITGGYQMARGAHFFSHTLGTMLIAWPLVTLLAWAFALLPLRSRR